MQVLIASVRIVIIFIVICPLYYRLLVCFTGQTIQKERANSAELSAQSSAHKKPNKFISCFSISICFPFTLKGNSKTNTLHENKQRPILPMAEVM